MALIIFPENYANSSWCMEELVKIMECRQMQEQMVIPIFYRVSVGDVRFQRGRFGTPFENTEQTFRREYVHRVPEWKAALRAASNLAGHVVPGQTTEPQLVDDIANEVLETISLVSPGETRTLVGIESRRKHLEKLLRFEDSESTRMVGVLGMPGIGKTTIANDMYILKRRQFDAYSFISIEWGQPIDSLQDKLLCDILRVERLSIGDRRDAHGVYKHMLCKKRVLIVLDNVSHKDQIPYLIGNRGLYRGGSRIIITTRDRKTIEDSIDAENIYQVPKLDGRESLKLFSLHAFPRLSKPPEELMDLTNTFLDYARGIPLALEVLGCDLRGKDISLWKYRLHNLESWRDQKIQAVLHESFKALSFKQEEAFLDIACFFRSENADYVRSLIDFQSIAGDDDPLTDLVDKCLVTISDDRLQMHDLLQNMGKEIVIEANNTREAGNLTRLWDPEHIRHVLKHKTGTGKIKGILLDMSKVEEADLSPKVFKKILNLRYLKLFNSHCSRGCEADCRFQFPRGLTSLPAALTYLHWQGYPLPDLPPDFNPRKLVDFKLPYSQIKRLWEDNKEAEKLKWIDLRYSRELNDLSILSNAPNLEILNLQGCSSLTTLCSSIERMHKLVYLNLRGCTSLTCLPGNINLRCLKTLILSGCSNLTTFPEILQYIEVLYLDGTAIEEVPASIAGLSELTILDLKSCHQLTSLPSCLDNLRSLQKLILSGCSMLNNFPRIHENMERLEVLLLDETTIRQMPELMQLSSLKTFSFCGAESSVPEGLLFPPNLSSWPLLRDLFLANCSLSTLPDDVSRLSSLQNLCLRENNFESLPLSIKKLHHLLWLDIKYCKRLQSLPVLPPNLQCLDAHGCDSLESVASPLTKLMVAERIHCTFIFTNCFNLNQKAEDYIVGYAQIKSQLMANASLKRYHRGSVMESLVDICYPGKEMPSWFSHQRTGSSVKTQLPPHWCDIKFIGFALCAVVSFDDCNGCSSRFSVKCTCEFENDNGYCISFTCTMRSWAETVVPGNVSRGIKSDHVFLGYNSCFHITKCYGEKKVDTCGYTTASFNFRVTDDTPRELDGCKVEKCGVNLFYAPKRMIRDRERCWMGFSIKKASMKWTMRMHQSVNSFYNQMIMNRNYILPRPRHQVGRRASSME